MGKRSKTSFLGPFSLLHDHIMTLNNSKIFAGLMIIVLNIASKFVTVKLSKTMESYLKHTFSRDMLVFAIAWMGTRDIYTALIIMLVFILCMDYLLNEESSFCCLPENFTDYHVSLLDNNETVTPDQIKQAEEVLAKAKKQKTQEKQQDFLAYSGNN
jgi:hypothetical protein